MAIPPNPSTAPAPRRPTALIAEDEPLLAQALAADLATAADIADQ